MALETKILLAIRTRLETKPLLNYSQEKLVDCPCKPGKIEYFILRIPKYQQALDEKWYNDPVYSFGFCYHPFIIMNSLNCFWPGYARRARVPLLLCCCPSPRLQLQKKKTKQKLTRAFWEKTKPSPPLPTWQWEMRKQVVLLWLLWNKLRYQSWTEELFNLVRLHASYAEIT